MGLIIKKLDNKEEIHDFSEKFCDLISYSIPESYFLSGSCYALVIDGMIKAGYCLVDLPLYNLRSINQVPKEQLSLVPQDLLCDLCEFTGYFILDKKYGLLFTAHLVKTILFHSKKKFVYSYPVDQKNLGKYYGYGNPYRIYTGKPERLDGHTDDMDEEHVEILSKHGICKIFLRRTMKYIGKGF